jgi:transcriptional regulator with XRE-family HTH domain
MTNMLLRTARQQQGWSQQQLADFAGVSLSTIERAERGEPIRVDNLERICSCLEKTPEQLGLMPSYEEVKRRDANKAIAGLVSGLFISSTGITNVPPLAELWADDLLTIYARGIAACQDLYYNGNPHQVEAILPLYTHQTALLAGQPGTLQQSAAKLASQAYQMACELATDREDFGTARQAGQQAFTYAQLAKDANLQVNALISLANLGWHLSSAQPCYIRRHSRDALQAYQQAVSLLDNNVTPLLKGRTYAGIAEVYAMRGEFQEAMRAMGLAYEHFPMKPEDDPAYPYLRASRYSLYVFGDAQSRLLLHQPKEAEKALIAMQKETHDPEIEPITKVDLLYYQAEAQIQQGEMEPSVTILTEAATLAKGLGSRLYFNKLAASYHHLEEQRPKERVVTALEEVFQPW